MIFRIFRPAASSACHRAMIAATALACAARVDAWAQDVGPAAMAGDGGTRVVVSRREVRVAFPRDTAGPWGWGPIDGDTVSRFPRYAWGMRVAEAIGAPRTLGLTVSGRAGPGRAFPTLADLVAEGRTALCTPGMMVNCTVSEAAATVEDGRVVIAFRDSATISRLFGLRPAAVTVWRTRPGQDGLPSDTVRVEYVAPEVPAPDSAFLAEAARARRRYQASVRSGWRGLLGGEGTARSLWIAVGDTVGVRVEESLCLHDLCGDRAAIVADSGWTVADESVARLIPTTTDAMRRPRWAPARRLVALRPGRTRLRVVGLHSASDTLPIHEPLPRELEREVVVMPPVGRVEVGAGARTARVGETVEVRAAAFDEQGRPMRDAPVMISIEEPTSRRGRSDYGSIPFEPWGPGLYTVTASFGGKTDTLTIQVVDSAR